MKQNSFVLTMNDDSLEAACWHVDEGCSMDNHGRRNIFPGQRYLEIKKS